MLARTLRAFLDCQKDFFARRANPNPILENSRKAGPRAPSTNSRAPPSFESCSSTTRAERELKSSERLFSTHTSATGFGPALDEGFAVMALYIPNTVAQPIIGYAAPHRNRPGLIFVQYGFGGCIKMGLIHSFS